MWLSAGELVVVGILALLVFGPEKLPELARQLARFVAQLQNIAADVRRNVDDVMHQADVHDHHGLPPQLSGEQSPQEQLEAPKEQAAEGAPAARRPAESTAAAAPGPAAKEVQAAELPGPQGERPQGQPAKDVDNE